MNWPCDSIPGEYQRRPRARCSTIGAIAAALMLSSCSDAYQPAEQHRKVAKPTVLPDARQSDQSESMAFAGSLICSTLQHKMPACAKQSGRRYIGYFRPSLVDSPA
jgi:hypothetical protein